MVRINLINPKNLSDQHLIAEYDEILMLIAYIRKYPSVEDIPEKFCLGKGHMKFFKNKVLYLKERHELIKDEMKKRGFRALKTISTKGFSKQNLNEWVPDKKDNSIIKRRIREKIMKKSGFYRYYRIIVPQKKLTDLLIDG